MGIIESLSDGSLRALVESYNVSYMFAKVFYFAFLLLIFLIQQDCDVRIFISREFLCLNCAFRFIFNFLMVGLHTLMMILLYIVF